jgi:hypothetical protein
VNTLTPIEALMKERIEADISGKVKSFGPENEAERL